MVEIICTHKRALALLSIPVIAVVSYLPSVDNLFIADDFGMFTIIQNAQRAPHWFFTSTTEFFRLTSYIYFATCLRLFGLNQAPYYWAGIALHGIVSILVFFLTLQVTRSFLASWASGLFFAAYERHQETIMWISAANETILALTSAMFLLFWRRGVDSESRLSFGLAHVMFAMALFSKEASVILYPLAVCQLLLAGDSVRAAIRKSTGLLVMLAGFATLWLLVASEGPFIRWDKQAAKYLSEGREFSASPSVTATALESTPH